MQRCRHSGALRDMSDYHTVCYVSYNKRFDVVTNTTVDIEFYCKIMKVEEDKKRKKIEYKLKE